AGVIVDPAEVDVAARRRVRRFRSWAEPEVVVEAFRHALGFFALAGFAVVGPATRQAAADRVEFADPSVAHQLAGPPKIAVEALLAARLEDALVLLDRVAHGPALSNCQGERLLTIDVLVGPGGGEDRQGVPVVGGANEDGVNVPASDQL